VNSGAAVQEALTLLANTIAETGAVVQAVDLPTVTADHTQLVQLFQNLIGNAIKYVPSDRTPRVEVAWRKQDGNILLWIKDNGIGIAPENHDRAFKVFQRLVTNEQYDGTGIGLAICKKIVEHHGGKIWIESDVGVGSTFFVTLPIAK
jgi:light-regulated signal transduction histidine kinase (bacteriophytochrome)